MVEQIISLIVIIIIGIAIFMNKKEAITIRNLAITSIFVTLSLALTLFSINSANLRIGFSQLPLMMLGFVLGPIYAFIGGIAQDFGNLFFITSGQPYLGFTLNKVLIALIPALLSKQKVIKGKSLVVASQAILGISVTVSIIGLFQPDNGVNFNTFTSIILGLVLVLALAASFVGVILFYNKYEKNIDSYKLGAWMASVILVEIVVQYLLTPLWLLNLMQQPFMFSLIVRLIKGPIMMLLNIYLGYWIYRALSKIGLGEGND